MNRNFLVTVYREVLNEFKSNDEVRLIAYDTQGYYYGLVYDSESLDFILKENIFREENLSGLIGDNLNFENICYDIETSRVIVNEQVLEEFNALNYAKRQLMKTIELGVNLEDELELNNKFVKSMNDLLVSSGVSSELDELDCEGCSTDKYNFNVLFVEENNITMLITRQQMCFMTSVGLVKLHDVNKSIELTELINLLSYLFKVDRVELQRVLLI